MNIFWIVSVHPLCRGLNSAAYIMCFQSCASRAMQAAFLFSPHQQCDPEEVASYSCSHWLPVCLEGCICFVYWKNHIFTTDSTPDPIKLRQRELFYSASSIIVSRVTSWGLCELLASLPIPGKAGITHRPWIMPFTFRFHLLLLSASLGINQFLFPLTQRPLAEFLAELLAALSQSCCQPFHQEILGPQVTSVTSASLELSWPLQEPSAPEARQHPHLRNYWAPACSAQNRSGA